jgi:hypothetical protein
MSLSLARTCRSALNGIDVPELSIGGKIFHANFSRHFRPRLAAPHDAKLRLGSFVHDVYYTHCKVAPRPLMVRKLAG